MPCAFLLFADADVQSQQPFASSLSSVPAMAAAPPHAAGDGGGAAAGGGGRSRKKSCRQEEADAEKDAADAAKTQKSNADKAAHAEKTRAAGAGDVHRAAHQPQASS